MHTACKQCQVKRKQQTHTHTHGQKRLHTRSEKYILSLWRAKKCSKEPKTIAEQTLAEENITRKSVPTRNFERIFCYAALILSYNTM